MKKFLLPAVCAIAALSASAQADWLHIYRYDSQFHTLPVDSVKSLLINPAEGNQTVTLTTVAGETTEIPLSAMRKSQIGYALPQIYITTEEWIDDVHDKTTKHAASIVVKSNGYPGMLDVESSDLKLRGRGNSTLGMPKKPYRLQFGKKIELTKELKKSKNYVLLANYIDNTLMRNALAFKIAQLLDLPYTNHSIPVDVWLNGKYRGAYQLTEKVGLNSGSIDDIDETEGVLLELDTNVDPSDTYLADSQGSNYFGAYRFPIAVKDPDYMELEEDGDIEDANEHLDYWAAEMERVENAIAGKSGEDWADLIDLESAVRYVMVYNLTGNCELKHPKSCFLRKAKRDEKFFFGPIWDFDWAYTYDNWEGGQSYDAMLFGGNNNAKRHAGSAFFMPIVSDERFQEMYKKLWDDFVANGYPELMKYFDEYAATLEPSAAHNGMAWPQEGYGNGAQSTSSFDTNVGKLRRWLDNRVSFISNTPNFGLYDDDQSNVDFDNPPEGMSLLELSADNVKASDPDELEGQVENLFDNDPTTIYHSNWHNPKCDTQYGSWLDIDMGKEATKIAFDLTSRMDNVMGIPSEIKLLASADGEKWEEFKYIYNESTLDNVGMTARFGTYTMPKGTRYVRFSVITAFSGPLTAPWFVEKFKPYFNLAELRVYTD